MNEMNEKNGLFNATDHNMRRHCFVTGLPTDRYLLRR